MGVASALVCILVASSPRPPYVAPCDGAKFTVARCTKAPAERWEQLRGLELNWARVDKNTRCLRVK